MSQKQTEHSLEEHPLTENLLNSILIRSVDQSINPFTDQAMPQFGNESIDLDWLDQVTPVSQFPEASVLSISGQ